MAEQHEPWLRLYITGDSLDQGVDGRRLAALLNAFADSLLVAARLRLNLPEVRAGRPSAEERRLAAARVRSVLPGSLDITYAEPPPRWKGNKRRSSTN